MEMYAPKYIVEIEGEEFDENISRSVESFEYEDFEDKMDELKIRVFDEARELVDHPQLAVGNTIKCRWGYIGEMSPYKLCTIKEIGYTFGENGAAMIEIRALDKGHKLTGRAARTCWQNKKIEDVVKEIAKKHDLTPIVNIPNDLERESFSQGGKNDMEFLQGLAEDAGCSVWVDKEELHFDPDKITESSVKFTYGQDTDGRLFFFQVRLNAEKGKAVGRERESVGIDPMTKEEIKHTSNAKELGVTVNLADGREEKETPLLEEHDESGRVNASPAATKEITEKENEGFIEKASMHSLEATAKTIGMPQVAAKQTIIIDNIGFMLSGAWRVKGIKHKISKAGYTCDLRLSRSDIGGESGYWGTAKKPNTNNPVAEETKPKIPPRVEVDLG